ncbi:MAG: hypothetical protein ACYC7F_11100, partial [Gemmatimonadaceae bacterium]
MIDGAGGLAAIALRGFVLLGILAAIGGWSFARVVLPRATGPAVEPYRASLVRVSAHFAMAGAALIALLIVPRAVVQALAVAAPGQPTGSAMVSVLQSGWGIALVVQGA